MCMWSTVSCGLTISWYPGNVAILTIYKPLNCITVVQMHGYQKMYLKCSHWKCSLAVAIELYYSCTIARHRHPWWCTITWCGYNVLAAAACTLLLKKKKNRKKKERERGKKGKKMMMVEDSLPSPLLSPKWIFSRQQQKVSLWQWREKTH